MSFRSVSPVTPGEASPSFAQTGAEFTLDDSDDLDDGDDDGDLRSEVGGSEAFELVGERDGSTERTDGRVDEALIGRRRRRRPSSTTVASFQLYTPDEDLAVRRKFDRKLVLFVALLFMLSFLDRSNIGNARIAGMDEDLQTDPPRDDWYEWALTAFYVPYIAFEWMSLLWKLIPAHVFVSMIVLAWGLTASLQAVATSYPVLLALRVLLGIAEAGFTGIPVYLSFFFRPEELAFRTAIFISGETRGPCPFWALAREMLIGRVAAPLATSFASTLAWAIVKFAELSPIAPWRLLFLLEGFPSVVVSVVAWHAIPDSPQTASYLSRREKKVARLRLRGEHSAQTGPARPTSGLRGRDLVAVFCDPTAWITAAMFFLTNMAYSSLPVFLPKIMSEMGHSAAASQALSAPPYLVAFVVVLFTAHMSDRLRARTVPIVFHALASALGYGALALSETLRLPPLLRYLAVYPAAVGFFNVVTLTVAWSINNQASRTRQGGGFALLQLVGQCGPLVGTRLYPDREAPYYSRGMRACAFAMFSVAVLALVLRAYLRYRNRSMDRLEEQGAADGTAAEEEELAGPGRRRTRPTGSFRYML
ncbi:transporter [Tolypocladium capitatum]|uniref:Transporter n=1 Tax=Tolypocladium capitatum TaxID=45235 RepID=A0A2K3QM49_9HYPO|nr:transporter [Tolypocladium capitatum]